MRSDLSYIYIYMCVYACVCDVNKHITMRVCDIDVYIYIYVCVRVIHLFISSFIYW